MQFTAAPVVGVTVTAVAPVRYVPLIVTLAVVPRFAEVGVALVMTGACAWTNTAAVAVAAPVPWM